MTDAEKMAFNHGYLIACCNIKHLHSEEIIACDVLAQLGLIQSDVDAMDLTEYDAEALAEIRTSRGDDPIEGPHHD